MNKKLLIIIFMVAILLIGCLVGAYFLFLNVNGDDVISNDIVSKADSITANSWLRASTVKEIEDLGKKMDKTVEFDSENAYVKELPFGDDLATYGYRINSEGNIVGLSIGMMLVSSTQNVETYTMESITATQLKERISAVLFWISEELKTKIDTDAMIIANDGHILSLKDESSYQQIMDGSALLELRILDTDNSVWILTVEMIPYYSIVSCTLEHCLPDSEKSQLPCQCYVIAE